MSVKERIKKYIEHKEMSIYFFENSIGASNAYVNSITKGIGGKFLEKIRETYDDLDINWLLTGEGSMLLKNGNEKFILDSEDDLNKVTDFILNNEDKLLGHNSFKLWLKTKVQEAIISQDFNYEELKASLEASNKRIAILFRMVKSLNEYYTDEIVKKETEDVKTRSS